MRSGDPGRRQAETPAEALTRERVLFVVHVERGERDRIVSARRATPGEREVYETGGQL